MDLEELRAFLAIVETGSFSSAANELGVSRGMLRRRVDALEARVGAPLVERSAKGVVITDAGAVLVKQGRRLIQSSSALLTAVREAAREPTGELRVALPVGLPPQVFGPILSLLRASIPKVVVHANFTGDPLGGMLDEVDVVLHFGDESPPAWVSHELLRVPVRLFATLGYLRRRGQPREPSELAEHPLLAWTMPGFSNGWPLHDGTTLRIAPVLASNDAHVLRQAMLAGIGVALLPDADIPDPHAAAGGIVRVLDEQVGCSLALRLSFPAVLAGSPKIAQIAVVAQQWVARLHGRGAG
jgi:molybdate transport repressor ModE-like protein